MNKLIVYPKTFELTGSAFTVSKRFPKDEHYTLTDPFCRSSRLVCAKIREASATRRYPAHFISKLSDADGENNEPDASLDFAFSCQDIEHGGHERLAGLAKKISAMPGSMINERGGILISVF